MISKINLKIKKEETDFDSKKKNTWEAITTVTSEIRLMKGS